MLREEWALLDPMMMSLIDVCSEYRGQGLGTRLYELVHSYAQEHRLWLLPMRDLTEDGIRIWLKHDSSAQHEVLTHPPSHALVGRDDGDLRRFDRQVRATASYC